MDLEKIKANLKEKNSRDRGGGGELGFKKSF